MVMPRALLDGTIPEKTFMAKVLDLAHLRGWAAMHVFDSRRSEPGWPDLAMVRDGRLVLAEIKTDKGRLSPPQVRWLDLLRHVELAAGGAVEVHVFRPSQWKVIEDVLR